MSTCGLTIILSEGEATGGGVWCVCGGSKPLKELLKSDPSLTVRSLCVIEGRCVWRGGESCLTFKTILSSVSVGGGSVTCIPFSVQESGFGSNGVFWTQKLANELFSISLS